MQSCQPVATGPVALQPLGHCCQHCLWVELASIVHSFAFAAWLPCEALGICSTIIVVGFLHVRDIIPHLGFHSYALRPRYAGHVRMPAGLLCSICGCSMVADDVKPDWLSSIMP